MKPTSIQEIRGLPYTRKVDLRDEPDGSYFVAYVEELPWIRIDGASREEAMMKLDQVFDDAILAVIESGDELPEPRTWAERYGAPAAQPAGKRYARGAAPRITYQTESQLRPWAPATNPTGELATTG